MDEIELVKAARPAVADYPAPDRTAARARLLAAAAEPAVPDGPRPARPGRRLPRLARRAAIAGALAIAVTAGVTISQQLSPDGKTPTAAPVANAAELAHNAAVAPGSSPFPYPRPHQWVYYKTLTVSYFRYDSRNGPSNDPTKRTGEWWVRVDREQAAAPPAWGRRWVRPARSVVITNCGAGATTCVVGEGAGYELLPSLPSDPDKLLTAIYRKVERDPGLVPGQILDQRAFNLMALVAGELLPADVHAALYTAIAKLPGVTVVQDAADAAGRHGVALARADGGIRTELILDKATYQYLGSRVVVTRDHHILPGNSGGPVVRAGQLLSWTARLAVAVVDVPCRRPDGTVACAIKAPATHP